MKSWVIYLSLVAIASALPADRWPNLGPQKHEIVKHEVVIITPTSEHTPHQYSYEVTPKGGPKYHSSYAIVDQHASHYPPPSKKRYDEAVIRKYYNNLVDSKVNFKKNLIKKVVDKTIGVTAKIAQTTVDFISRIAIGTAANLAKNGADHVIQNKADKFNSKFHYSH